LHGIADICIEACQLFFQSFDEPGDALPEPRCGQALLALAFGPDHCDDLAPTADKIGQQPVLPSSGSGRGSRLVASAKCAMTRHRSDRSVARWPIALAKARTCAGVDDHDRQPRGPGRLPPRSQSPRWPPTQQDVAKACAAAPPAAQSQPHYG